ncbi:DNA-3-methyladenine glycosylase [Sphingomonas sanguinis]|uniref:Putative 3-methyladenine DNA glycosylase n=1 Tax=Sphingomonas sanguinis TaxID=33051 RepID=A0ABU5LKU0_9SPHN|nr:DNA-3-methyladenine glycosylase [Sphingomonas sanguinis]MDZ7280546.1 DNA-3-methyladenine glycosylase [Sphingomonas sanguinis]QXT36198.1 DNA-3-methyladenine glycosylase [Sphingomonas sanguinis]
MNPLPQDFYQHDVDAVARALIGMILTVDGVGGVIVETEAYDAADPASHSFAGRTARNAAMFGPVGHAYVYRIYGLHHCLNIVCGTPGSAVLIRALEPRHGIDVMRERRGSAHSLKQLCSGPGKLCSALGIDLGLNGAPLAGPPFAVTGAVSDVPIVIGPRIGITQAAERPRRFGWKNSPWLSRPFAT